MNLLTDVLVVLVTLLHLWFFTLEMFLWQRPIGLKTFKNSREKAKITSVLAANQGLYNAFLAAGLIASFCFANPETAHAFRVFFLSCVVMAGVYGAYSANVRILFIQALPAALALVVMFA